MGHQFVNLIRRFMKAARETVITSEIDIKSNTLRRVGVNEVIELVDSPEKDETADILRARCRAMSDGLEGFITIRGNISGADFVTDGGHLFIVVKDTILTPNLGLEGGGTTRKLREGDIVKVREWARKEEKSGLMRMKCQVKSNGVVGWVTTVGNQGSVYVESL